MKFRALFFLLIVSLAVSVWAREGGDASAPEGEAAALAASLDDPGLAAQVILTGIEGKGALSPAMRTLLAGIPAGGILLFRYNLDTSPDEVKALIAEASALAARKTGIPPFAAVDHEGGLVRRFGQGIETLSSAYSFRELAQREGRDAALALAETLYSRSAKEIRELGITLALGPVAETLNADNRLFLETRSYGSDPDFTQAAASVFIRSMNAAGIACAVKHFPGNSGADPHKSVSVLDAGKEELDELVKPFAGIIRDSPPDAVMISHVFVPAVDGKRNSSLSRAVIEGWLRGGLGFEGIALADDYSMAAAAAAMTPGEAAVEALNAGVDMIMAWPSNLSAIHAAILEALNSGRLERERLREATGRVIAAKIRRGLVPVRLFNAQGGSRGETP